MNKFNRKHANGLKINKNKRKQKKKGAGASKKHKAAVKAVSGPSRTGKRARKDRLMARKVNKMVLDDVPAPPPKKAAETIDAMME